MPRLSDTMEEGKILKWLKNVGDQVADGDVLAEVETDKANMELEAFDAGVLSEIRVAEGDAAPVGAVIAILGGDAKAAGQAAPKKPAAKEAAPAKPAPAAKQSAPAEEPATDEGAAAESETGAAPAEQAAEHEEQLLPVQEDDCGDRADLDDDRVRVGRELERQRHARRMFG